MMRASTLAALTAAMLLAGCSDKASETSELDKIDAKLGGKTGIDPALSVALEEPIMVDPNLTSQANEDSIRPPTEPFQAPVPLDPAAPTVAGSAATLGSFAEQQARLSKDQFSGCVLDVQYSMDFANRLPLDLPLPPRARLIEAAGSDAPNCRLRAVTYSIGVAPKVIADHVAKVGQQAGYSIARASEGSETLVSGARGRDRAAFYAIIQASGTGSAVDLVVNNGR